MQPFFIHVFFQQLISDHGAFKASNGGAEEEKNAILSYVDNQGADYETGNHYTSISPQVIMEDLLFYIKQYSYLGNTRKLG